MIENFKRVWLESMPSFCIYMLLSMLFAPVFDGPGGRQSLFHSVMALIFCALWGIQALYRWTLRLYIGHIQRKSMGQIKELIANKIDTLGQEISDIDSVQVKVTYRENKIQKISMYISHGEELIPLKLDEAEEKYFCEQANSQPKHVTAQLLLQKSYQYSHRLEIWILFLGIVNLVYIMFRG